MHCIKCGKETKGSDVFCQDCLLIMQTQPVKPGTAVHIPVRPASKKASRKKVLSPEEQVNKLRKQLRKLSWVFLALILALAVTTASTLYLLHRQGVLEDLGKNYSTVTTEST
jgi:hypothetical protein